MSEQVNHPSHYQVSGRKECIYEMLDKYGARATAAFALLSAYKYLYRAGNKADNPETQDIDKAKWYYEFTSKLVSVEPDTLSGLLTLYTDVERALCDLGVL